VLTGQDCCKSQDEVDMFGGNLGNYEGNIPSFDGGCVDNPFRWCDNLGNNDPALMTIVSRAFAKSVVQQAFNKDLTSPIKANATVQKVTLPTRAQTVECSSRNDVIRAAAGAFNRVGARPQPVRDSTCSIRGTARRHRRPMPHGTLEC
jgi:hypothetical protein